MPQPHGWAGPWRQREGCGCLPLSSCVAGPPACPSCAGDVSRHEHLLAALEGLAAAGVVVLPVQSWDRSFRPPLPRFVTVPAARRVPRGAPWRRFPWRPELGWAASVASLNDGQFAALVAINDWLSAGGSAAAVVPQRVRSAEVLGHEKALDVLSTSALWAEHRLSWELLRAERLAPPIVVRRVGPGPELLVVENADPFWLCAQILASHQGAIGRVAWGAGKAFLSTTPALASEPERPTRLWYWGDADPEGVRIPTAAARLVGAQGLPPLRPHPGLWGAYAACAVSEPGRHTWEGVPASWLGPKVSALLDPARTPGGRIPQEAVGLTAIRVALARGGT